MSLCMGGVSSTLMVTEDGDMSVVGCNMSAELGLGHTFHVEHPTLLDKHAFGGDVRGVYGEAIHFDELDFNNCFYYTKRYTML